MLMHVLAAAEPASTTTARADLANMVVGALGSAARGAFQASLCKSLHCASEGDGKICRGV